MFDFLFKKPFQLEITDSAIRISDAQKNLEVPLPPGIVVQGKIQNTGALIQALQALKDQKSLSSYRCVLALPAPLCFERTIPFPPEVKEGDLKEFLEGKVPKVIPLTPEELRYDYTVIQEGQERRVGIVATRLKLLNAYQECLEKAGLKCVAARPAASLFRAEVNFLKA